MTTMKPLHIMVSDEVHEEIRDESRKWGVGMDTVAERWLECGRKACTKRSATRKSRITTQPLGLLMKILGKTK